MYHFQNYLEQSLTAYIWTYILYKKHTKFVDHLEQKVTTNPKLGQDRKNGSIDKKETYNYLLIVFILTLYSLQKNTRFVDRVEQKVTTNPTNWRNWSSFNFFGKKAKQVTLVLIVLQEALPGGR